MSDFLHSGIDAASVELNLSFSQYRCRLFGRPHLASHLLSVCLFYNMKLSSARSAKAGKRWHEVSVVSWKRPKATGDRNVLRNHILNFDIVTLCKLIFYNVYVRTLNQKNVFFSMCGLLVLGKESFIPKKLDFVGVKRLFRAQCCAVLQKKKKKKDELCARVQYFLSALLPQCYHLFTEIKQDSFK